MQPHIHTDRKVDVVARDTQLGLRSVQLVVVQPRLRAYTTVVEFRRQAGRTADHVTPARIAGYVISMCEQLFYSLQHFRCVGQVQQKTRTSTGVPW